MFTINPRIQICEHQPTAARVLLRPYITLQCSSPLLRSYLIRQLCLPLLLCFVLMVVDKSVVFCPDGRRQECSCKARMLRMLIHSSTPAQEFLAGALTDQTYLSESTLRTVFDYFDKNHDGSISTREIQEILAEFHLPEAAASELLRIADED